MKTCTTEDCTRPAWARGFCAPHYSTWHRAQLKYTVVCEQCGKTAKMQGPNKKYCSRTCSARAKIALAGAARVAQQKNAARNRRALRSQVVPYVGPRHAYHPASKAKTATTSRRSFKSGQCRVCQGWFITLNTDLTCSQECFKIQQRAVRNINKDRRRAVKRDAYVADVSPRKVFERDGYRCHLCRKKTLPHKQAPHPRAPTVDHVIPLAAGGTHEPLNCRTSCFLCNSRKGDRGGGEQLLLIA